MDITSALALRLQQSQLDLGLAVLRAGHEAQQTLVNVLTEQAQAGAAANPEHLGQYVDVLA